MIFLQMINIWGEILVLKGENSPFPCSVLEPMEHYIPKTAGKEVSCINMLTC